ncbi:hypothetical protein Tco_0843382 [Tanacetum coccineum]|uniref:Uncharacterized protein n=1 Tax=Tanacetum coccineum TaxID=301880 RepID=A0ABQ5B2H6_9ASTR
MNPSGANQISLDNALVAPEARLKIGECNRRIEFTKPQREATYQVTLDALKLSPFYPAFLITAGICPKLLDQPFDIPPSTDEEILLSTGAFSGKPLDLITLVCLELKFCGGVYHCKNVDLLNSSGKTLHSKSTITSQREPCPILDS